MNEEKYSQKELLSIWLSLARQNKWIASATDPVFSLSSFMGCDSERSLKANLLSDKPPVVGQAYFYKNTCFVNQFPDLPCWLILKNDLVIDHNSFEISRRLNVVDQQLYYYLHTANSSTILINPVYSI